MSERPSVSVHLASVSAEASAGIAGTPRPERSWKGRYTTFVLTAADPVQCILEEDPDRVEAYVLALDNDVVIGTKGQVQATQNTAANVPQPIGAYVPSKANGGSIVPFPVRDSGAVYAGVTTTAASSRVSVAAYYRE